MVTYAEKTIQMEIEAVYEKYNISLNKRTITEFREENSFLLALELRDVFSSYLKMDDEMSNEYSTVFFFHSMDMILARQFMKKKAYDCAMFSLSNAIAESIKYNHLNDVINACYLQFLNDYIDKFLNEEVSNLHL